MGVNHPAQCIIIFEIIILDIEMAVSTGSAANTVAEDKDDISYGVEMEFVFAFHESKLQPMLETANGFQGQSQKNHPAWR